MIGRTFITKYSNSGYEFTDLLSWKPLNDNKGNPNGRKARRKYRKILARKAKRNSNKQAYKDEYLDC